MIFLAALLKGVLMNIAEDKIAKAIEEKMDDVHKDAVSAAEKNPAGDDEAKFLAMNQEEQKSALKHMARTGNWN